MVSEAEDADASRDPDGALNGLGAAGTVSKQDKLVIQNVFQN